MNSGDLSQEVALDKALAAVLISCIKSHTSVNLQKTRSQTPEEIKEKRTLQFSAVKDCILFIKVHFSTLGIAEIKDAFSMISAGKINVDIETYGGEFEPVHLGRVLNAYLKFRKKVIAEYEKKNDWEMQQQKKHNLDELNESARKRVEIEYIALLRYYQETGDFYALDTEVSAFWGKLLVDNKVIELDDEKRTEIIAESKKFVRKQIENEALNLNKSALERKGARKILKILDEKKVNSDFTARWHVRYAQLVVIKSILNHE